jgi:hypothetical protein
MDERQGGNTTDRTNRQVTDRQSPTLGIGLGAFQHRRDRAAEVGAQHEGDRGGQSDDASRCERGDQQHHGNARVGSPRQDGRKRQIEQRLASEGAKKNLERRRRLYRLDRAHKLVQGESMSPSPMPTRPRSWGIPLRAFRKAT